MRRLTSSGPAERRAGRRNWIISMATSFKLSPGLCWFVWPWTALKLLLEVLTISQKKIIRKLRVRLFSGDSVRKLWSISRGTPQFPNGISIGNFLTTMIWRNFHFQALLDWPSGTERLLVTWWAPSHPDGRHFRENVHHYATVTPNGILLQMVSTLLQKIRL